MSRHPQAAPAIARSRWTASDEAQLQELIERKARIMTESREPLLGLATRVLNDWQRLGDSEQSALREDPSAFIHWITDELIGNADALRDALAPFDSGVRPDRSGS